MSPRWESIVEDVALAWLESLGYAVKHGPEIAPVNFSLSGGTSCKQCNNSIAGQYAKNALCCFEKGNRFQMGNSSISAVDANELRKRLGNYRG